MRKPVYYVAVSLDGYIAGPRGEVDFYPLCDDMTTWINENYPEAVPTHIRKHVGMPVETPNRLWDTAIMGRGAYDSALEAGVTSPYHHLKQYVFSRTLAPVGDPQVDIVDTDPAELVRELKLEDGLDIWLCGGSSLAGQLIDEIDQLIFKSHPVIVGDGLPALSGNFAPARCTVTQRHEFSSGAQMTWLDRA